MNNQTNTFKSEWLKEIFKILDRSDNRSFIASDFNHEHVLIEWEITNILSPRLATFKKNMSALAAQTTAKSETDYLHQHPEAVTQDPFLKSYASFFESGAENVDWTKLESAMQQVMKQFYLADINSFGEQVINKLKDDAYFFAQAKDIETRQPIGFLIAAVTPALAYGDIKLINVVVIPNAQERGIVDLLLGSIFKVLNHTLRLFTLVRPTNTLMLNTYEELGFTQNTNPEQDPNHSFDPRFFIYLEYDAEQHDQLQSAADLLEE